jgi:hypothetical protein
MRKDWFAFLNAVNKSASRTLAVSAISLSLLFSFSAQSEETGNALASLPEVELKVVQKNANGNQYQIGDRIPLFVELKPEWIQEQTSLTVKPPEGGSKIEDQGWYIDPQTLLISNNLQFVVSPIQTGKLTLPTLIISKEDKTPIARTSAFSIQVSGPGEKKGESELLEPINVALATKYWVMLGLIFVLIAGLATYFIRRHLQNKRLNKPVVIPVVKKEPEHVIAMQALDQLYKKYPYSSDHLKPVAFGVSEILKHFFSARFRIDASEATTDEMVALLRNESLPSDSLREVLSLFQDLDLIKFTKGQEAHHFNEQHYIEFKVKAQSLIQKWANRVEVLPSGASRS